MKKFFQWVMAATLVCGASVFTSCSFNDDFPVSPDQPETTMPRVSKIYKEGHMVYKKNVMGSWMTVMDKVNERALDREFFWTGNRLDSAKDVVTDTTWEMEYDEQGRLVHEYTRLGSFDCTYEYDNKGRLSKTMRFVLYDEEGYYDRYFAEYTYDGDKLKKTVERNYLYGDEVVNIEESEYTWDGDNVVSLSIVRTGADGTVISKENITAEYSDYLNPFRNFVHFQQGYISLTLMDKMWAFSKNVPKMMSVGENARYEYDCTITGDRITTFHSHALVESETIFTETTSKYDIEYLD